LGYNANSESPNYSEERANPAHHKSHRNWPGIEPDPLYSDVTQIFPALSRITTQKMLQFLQIAMFCSDLQM